MNSFSGILTTVLPVAVMLLLGVLCRRKKIITPEGINGLQQMVMNIALPAALFSTFYKASVTAEVALYPLTYVAVLALTLGVGFLLGKVMTSQDQYFPFVLAGYEGGMIGYALITLLKGPEGMARYALMDLGVGVATYTIYITLIRKVEEKDRAFNLKETLLSMVKTPALVGEVGGLLVAVTGLGALIHQSPAGVIVDSLCDFISAPTSAAILLVIGYRIEFKGIQIKKVAGTILTRIAIQLVICLGVLGLFHLLGGEFDSALTRIGVILTAILPPTFVLPIYMKNEEARSFYSSVITVYTLITMVAFAIMSAVC